MNLEDLDEFRKGPDNHKHLRMPLFPLIPKIFYHKMSSKRFTVEMSIYKFLAKISEI